MDGLSITTKPGVSTTAESIGNTVAKPSSLPSTNPNDPSSFAATLKQAIGSVDQLQKQADVATQNLVTGKTNNIHETMIATEKADIALKLMVQVRNKMIDAYQEIMKMQV